MAEKMTLAELAELAEAERGRSAAKEPVVKDPPNAIPYGVRVTGRAFAWGFHHGGTT